MGNFFRTLFGYDPLFGGVPRSPKWPAVRAAYLKLHPACAICGGNKELNVHHKKPYHLYPALELDPTNLVTLCNHLFHHLTFGHLGDFSSYNVTIDTDVLLWGGKFTHRPSGQAED